MQSRQDKEASRKSVELSTKQDHAIIVPHSGQDEWSKLCKNSVKKKFRTILELTI